MKDRLRAALDDVHAEPEFKAAARAAVARRTHRGRGGVHRLGLALATAACAACLVLGGRWLYFTPAAYLSVDINPSLELGVNRLDRVISVQGWNDDGAALARNLAVMHCSYTDALDQILQSDAISTLLAQGAVVEIGVIGDDETRCSRMLEDVRACTVGQGNAYCYRMSSREAQQAHACGLFGGKYRAYLALAALDPSVTPETVQNMTMRQLREAIAALSGTSEAPAYGQQGPVQQTPGRYGAGHHPETENGDA